MQNHRVLFLCSMNLLRSPTAEQVFSCVPGLDVRSAGLDSSAELVCMRDDVDWADQVFVMEGRHRKAFQKKFPDGKHVIVLGIPDVFSRMQPELVEILLQRVPQFLPVPVDDAAVRSTLALNPPGDLPIHSYSTCW